MKEAIALLSSICPMPAELKLALHDMGKRIDLSKWEVLHKRGDICTNLYFIEKGLLCCYDKEAAIDKEYCVWLMEEGNIVTCVNSFDTGEASAEKIMALENCTLWTITKPQLEALTAAYREFATIRIKLTERYHVQSRNMDAQRKRPPELFFDYLNKEYPHLVTRVPNKHLSSFMGIWESTLYQIKKNKRRK
jgi:CRP-like cAMP-binding protein